MARSNSGGSGLFFLLFLFMIGYVGYKLGLAEKNNQDIEQNDNTPLFKPSPESSEPPPASDNFFQNSKEPLTI